MINCQSGHVNTRVAKNYSGTYVLILQAQEVPGLIIALIFLFFSPSLTTWEVFPRVSKITGFQNYKVVSMIHAL